MFDLSFKLFLILVSTFVFKLKLRLRNCSFGNNLKVSGKVYVALQKKGAIKIGNNFRLNSNSSSNLVGISNKASFQIIANGRIEIGNNCGFTSTVLSSRSLIKIGDYIKIGGNVRIFDHDYHSLKYLNRRESKLDSLDVMTAPVIIEDEVFIGTNSIILKGVHIGARSIIGAGSVVSLKIIPPDSIVAGNPALIIRSSTSQ